MEKDLIKFNDNVEMINKEFSIYKDIEVGSIFYLNTVHLLAKLEYLELTKEEYNTLKFQNKIEDLKYNIINVKRPALKSDITGKKEDQNTITEKEVAVRQIWNVSNGVGSFKSFINKDEAIKLADEINNKVFDYLK